MTNRLKADIQEILDSYPGVSQEEKKIVIEMLICELECKLTQLEEDSLQHNKAKLLDSTSRHIYAEGSDGRFYVLRRHKTGLFPLSLIDSWDREEYGNNAWEEYKAGRDV